MYLPPERFGVSLKFATDASTSLVGEEDVVIADGQLTLADRLRIEREYVVRQIKMELPGMESSRARELNSEERRVGELLLGLKNAFVERARLRPDGDSGDPPPPPFVINLPFSEWRNAEDVVDGPLFRIVKRFPKGVIQHVHFSASVPSEWLVCEACKLPYVYIYRGPETDRTLPNQLAVYQSESEATEAGFVSLKNLHDESPNPKAFEYELVSDYQMMKEDEALENSPERRWIKFQRIFQLTGALVSHDEFAERYFMQMVQTFVNDSILSAEIRTGLGGLKGFEKKKYSPEEHLAKFLEWDAAARLLHPDWLGIRIIHETSRRLDPDEMMKILHDTIRLQHASPHVVAFDMVGEEDSGFQTRHYWDILAKALEESEMDGGKRIRYAFHAGETDWETTNIVDALVLGASRIGHAFDLYQSKELVAMAKRQCVGLEVCPISNYVLGYIRDLRLHPAINYLNDHLLVSLSPDDPGIMGYEGVSHDFFAAVLAFFSSSPEGLLGGLRRVALTSISASFMSDEEKVAAKKQWVEKYSDWIEFVLGEFGSRSG